MSKSYSLNIGKPFGIRVSIHWTFLMLIAWVIAIGLVRELTISQILMHILFVLAVFACIVLHELGHSLTAIKYGGKVKGITLLPIGGMANMTKMPETPREDFMVSAAGPLVNIVIAGVIWLAVSIFGTVDFKAIEFDTITPNNFLLLLVAVNLFIVAFNLIPAFPMDGGRIFRAALSVKMSKVEATRVAKNIGQFFAVAFIITGLFVNPFLVVIGIFIFIGAKAEYEMMRYQDALHDYTVADIIISDYIVLHIDDTLQKAADTLVHSSDNGFMVASDYGYQGVLTKDNLIEGLTRYGKEGKVKDAMNTNVKPVSPDTPLLKVFQEMKQNRCLILPVFSNGKLKGILDLEKIHEFILIQKAAQQTDTKLHE